MIKKGASRHRKTLPIQPAPINFDRLASLAEASMGSRVIKKSIEKTSFF